jgi:hypothetical protein
MNIAEPRPSSPSTFTLAGSRVAPVTDWNPSDPDTAKVFYDLTAWDFDQQAELASALADLEIPHTWEGNELVIPAESEEEVDAVFTELEARLDITPANADGDADADADADADVDTESPAEWAVLEATTPTTDYDLSEWSDLDRSLVTESLDGAAIGYRFVDGVLSVPTAAESVVDDILDEVEAGEMIPVINDGPEGDALPFESLNSFFLAGERLRKDARDADGLERLLEAIKIADPDRPPRGVELRVWRMSCELAEQLADVLVDGSEDEVITEAQPVAEALHDLLRPLI